MSSKNKVTNKQMASLGIRKTETGDWDYIDLEEKKKAQQRQMKKTENK